MSKLATSPVIWLPLTLAVYLAASELQRWAGRSPLLNPTLLTVASVCTALVWLGASYKTYFDSVAVLHYLLGTAVVALAILHFTETWKS
jgi:putative effector of murein hydrolase